MKELKSKKTGRVSVYTDEEYQAMVDKGVIDMKRFIVTNLSMKPIVPSLKEIPKEVKIIKKQKNEG